MNFPKPLVLLKSNLKLQIYKRETAKQKIANYRAEFPMKIYPSASRNSVKKSASAQKPEVCGLCFFLLRIRSCLVNFESASSLTSSLP